MRDIPRMSGLLGSVNWTDKKESAAGIKDFYESRTQKLWLEAIAARNWAWLDGQQNREWFDDTRRMEIPLKRKKEREYLIYNMLTYMLVRRLSKLTRTEPVWSVTAATSDEHDQMCARLGNDLLGTYYREILDMPEKSEKFLRKVLSSPVTWLEPTWDPMAGDAVKITPDTFMPSSIPDDANTDQIAALQQDAVSKYKSLLGYGQQAEQQGYVTQYQGDLKVHIRTIFEVLWYPFVVQDWDQVHAYLVSVVMSPEEVAQRYHIPLSKVLQYRNGMEAQEHATKIFRGWTSPFTEMPGLDLTRDNGVLVHIFYGDKFICPPTPQNPKGGVHAVLIGNSDECIMLGPLGNAMGVLPLFPMVENPSNIFAWGSSSVDTAIPAQKEINDSRTDRKRWRADCKVRPRMVVSQSDGNPNPAQALKTRDAPYVVKDMNQRPQPLIEPSDFGDDNENDLWNQRFIQDAMATPDVDMGKTDQTMVKSGIGVQALKAGSNEALVMVGRGLNRTFSKVGTFCHAELQQKAEAPRITGIVGDNGRREWKVWSAADLRPTIYDVDPGKAATVSVTCFSTLPLSPPEVEAKIVNLYNMGAIDVQKDRQLIVEGFGLGDYRSILDRGRAGRDKAQLQVERWRKGEMVDPVVNTDDHAAMIEVYKKFVATDEYVEIAMTNPMLQQEIDAHLEQHQFQLYCEQAREEARAILAQATVAREFAAKAAALQLPGPYAVFMQRAGGLPDPNAVAQTQAGAAHEQQSAKKREGGGATNPPQGQQQRQSPGAPQGRPQAVAA